MEVVQKPHLVCIPSPAQSHIGALMKLAKLLHHKGFHITFVNTEYNHNRLLRARGPDSVVGLPDFQFKTIPDGLPPSDANTTQDLNSLFQAILSGLLLTPFINLIGKLNDTSGIPSVTGIISDGFMAFTISAAEKLRIPITLFWTIPACSFMAMFHFRALVQNGISPLKDESYLSNGYLDTIIDWIPGMKDIQLKDLPSFVRCTDPEDLSFKFCMESTEMCTKVSSNIIHTFDALEKDLLETFSSMFPPFYAIGPLQLLLNNHEEENKKFESIKSNLWKEETECLQWLDSKEVESVIYVNFGSLTVITHQQMVEFGWGLANSQQYFLWIIRPDLVVGESAIFPPEFEDATKERGIVTGWCPQEQVLNHLSIGGFLTHCGWNSTIESLSAGVPMICWPFFADQQTNCRYICREWQVGMEIDHDVKRADVESLVREIMGGGKGRELKKKAMQWKKSAEEATMCPNGSSNLALEKFVNKLLFPSTGC